MRFVGIDVHRDFCEVAIVEEGGRPRRAGRVASDPQALRRFAEDLGAGCQVALEATGNALAIARILESHVERVVICDPRATRAMTRGRAKTDRIDAATLARLLAAGVLDRVWAADEASRVRRRLTSRRVQLVHQRTREKNQVHAVLHRGLLGRPPMSDLFGVAGRRWLSALPLASDERLTVEGCLRQIDVLDAEVGLIEVEIARQALECAEMRRLMTIPGIDAVSACALIGAIGDISRFPNPRALVAYLGLDPRVDQSGEGPARGGRISKQGPGRARHVLVEAAWILARSPGPLRAFHQRIRARRGANVATVAVARKLAVTCWHMLSRQEDYLFARPALTAQKLRRLELKAGAERRRGHHPQRVFASSAQHALQREPAARAEIDYSELTRSWQPRPKVGAGATRGRVKTPPVRRGSAADL